jgi:hypothetical protein
MVWLFTLGLLMSHPLMGRDTIEEVAGNGLIIRSEPSGARVYVDGVERGLTPLILETLPGGEYAVRIHKDGYVDRRFKAAVRSTSRLMISVDLEKARGQVQLAFKRSAGSPPEDRLPLDPTVVVDTEIVRGSLISLPVGYRTISVRAFGWEEAVKTVYVTEGSVQSVEFNLRPASFALSRVTLRRSRFNPENAGSLGTAEFGFEVSGPGRGWVAVKDARGETVYRAEIPPFASWSQSARWNGRSARGEVLPDGVYSVLISAESLPWDDSEPINRYVRLEVTVDSSVSIRPLSLASGLPGLLYSPIPEVLPPRSFQLEGSMLFGKPPVTEKTWGLLPFAAAFRVSPAKRLELAASLNVMPEFNTSMKLGISGSAKWMLREPDRIPVAAALGLAYGWTREGAISPFGMGAGAEIFLPLGWRIHPLVLFALTPALIWTGDKGYPAEPAPRSLLSGGLLFQRSIISAGISLRSEYKFTRGSGVFGPLLAGGEVKIFPSNLVISLLGGAWFRGSRQGGFGGVGIGLIY